MKGLEAVIQIQFTIINSYKQSFCYFIRHRLFVHKCQAIKANRAQRPIVYRSSIYFLKGNPKPRGGLAESDE